MGLAAFLCVAFIVAGVAGWHLLKARREGRQASEQVRLMFSMAMWMAAIVSPIQVLAGDTQGLNTLEYQPAKIAALEGDWESESRAPELLFGIPDMKNETTHFKIAIPYLGSLILTHSLDGKVPGLKDYPKEDRPYSPLLFFSFRIMIALGMLMVLVGLWSLYLRWKGKLYDTPLLHRIALFMSPAGFLALLCGWITTEVGRQPFTVYGLLRTSDSVSPIALPNIATSMIAFVIVYFIVFTGGITILLRTFAEEPHPDQHGPAEDQPQRAAGTTQVSHQPQPDAGMAE
ncbi:cyanide-insensitive terminal oxidase CioA [Gluconobacter oxydans NBRC 3293]|nr:cyanide-insensitive terminal oxidase CioA [Gluconobacter oxydans NBRC 3293]